MPNAPIEQDVILDADGRPLFSAIDQLQRELGKIQATVKSIQQDSYKSAQDFTKVIADRAKQLQQVAGQLRTLATVKNTPGASIQDLNSNKRLADLTRQATAYARELGVARNAAEAIDAKIASINKRMAERGANGQFATLGQTDQLRNLERAQTALKKLDQQFEQLQIRARQTGGDFTQEIRNVVAARDVLYSAASKTKGGYNLGPQIIGVTDAQAALAERVAKARADEAANINAGLRAQKEMARAEVGQLSTINELEAARALNVAKIRDLREQLAAAEGNEVREILQSLEVEKARGVQIKQNTQALVQQQRAQEKANAGGLTPSGLPTGNNKSRLQNILSPGYAAAALARTSVYGLSAFAAYGAYNFAQNTVSDVVGLEDEFGKLQAISDSTDTEMQSLRASILSVGQSSRFAVTDLVKISQTLAQAGVSASQMTDVLKSVITLATASGSTPDEAVNLVTSALGAFQLQAREAARVADLMTVALNRTKLTVGQVGEAIQYVGATAYEQNISLEELLATIGAIAQGGVRSGSTIGTGLRQFIVGLQTPTKALTDEFKKLGITQADVDIKTRGLSTVLDTLKQKGFGATQAYQGLEVRAAAAYLVLKNNVDVIDELQLGFAQQNAAAIANDRAMGSLTAAWQKFKNTVEASLSGGLQEPINVLKNLLDALTERLQKMQEVSDRLKQENQNGTEAWYNKDLATPTAQFLTNVLNGDYGGFSNSPNRPKIGDWINSWTEGTKSAADSTNVYADAIKKASEDADNHRQILTEVDKEIERLKTQQSSLINNQVRSQTETVTLTARFQGLVKYLGTTKNAYLDLINAMNQYRGEESHLLSTAYYGLVAQQQKQNNVDQGALSKQISTIKGNRQLMGLLTPQERASLNSPQSLTFPQMMTDAASRVAKSNTDLANVLNDAANIAARLSIGTRSAILDQQQAGLAAAASTPLGQQYTAASQTFQARLADLTPQDQSTRTKLGGALSKDITTYLNQLNAKLPNIKQTANRQYVQDAIDFLNSLLNQVSAAIKPTKEELAQAKQDAADQRRQEAELRKRPLITQQDIDNLGLSLGLKLGSGMRSAAAEDALHRRGLTTATGQTSAHVTGHGFARDFLLRGVSDQEAERAAATIRALAKSKGIDAYVKYERGGPNDGTGRHIHVGVRAGTRFSKDREGTNADRYDAQLSEAQTQLDKTNLATQLKEVANATSQSAFQQAFNSAKQALSTVNTDLENAAKDELASKGIIPGSPEYQAKMAQVQQEVAQNIEQFQQKIGEAIVKSVDAQLKAAQHAFDMATAPSQTALAVAQAQQTGLSNYSLKNKVPDYVNTLAQARAQQAQETADRAKLAALPAQIAAVQGQKYGLLGDLVTGTGDFDTISAKVNELDTTLKDLMTTQASLKAQLEAGSLVPTTFSEGLTDAIAAYRQVHDMTKSFKGEIIDSLGGALDTLGQGFTDFFTNIMNGSQTVLQAFGNFAKSIEKYMVEIAAKAVATKVFDILLNVIGGAFGGGANSAGVTSGTGEIYNKGGRVGDPSGMIYRASGGEVMNGDTGRDSVQAALTRGEWVIQKPAVDSLGNKFMANLNNHGAKALDGLQKIPQVNVLPKQEMGVYIVAPQQQPSLDKNDVLVVMHNDILNNGQTKKLIKLISQGG